MTGKISPKIPDDSDPTQQYSKGVPQYGQDGSGNPEDFQSYMNDGLTQGASSSTSPMDMMSQAQNSNFGPPGIDASSAAPENFGPPGIAQTSDSQGSSFGPPSDDQSAGQSTSFGGPSAGNLTTNSDDQNTNLGATKGGGGGGGGGSKKKKHTYGEVEKMEANNMLNNAMQHMRVKDPDPSAWQ